MRLLASVLLLLSTLPLAAQDLSATLLKHLKTSKDFTLKVAEAMPEDSYGFKLTPAQMSFGEQMIHIASAQDFFLSYIEGVKTSTAKPKSTSKADIVAFVTASFDKAISRVEKATPKQWSTVYKTEEGQLSGLELVMLDFDHTTNHRASAEMYLRAKGITPPKYEF